jgi:hypothetical protein
MKLSWTYDHNNGASEWARRDMTDWLTDIFEAPAVQLKQGATAAIRQHVRSEFVNEGWATNVKISDEHDLTVFSLKDDLAVQLQTGNMSRAPYDLLKLQYLKTSHRIEAAALALPTKAGGLALGSNIAHADRVRNELYLFRDIITIPILLVAFE